MVVAQCGSCGKGTSDLRTFMEFVGMKPCVVRDDRGTRNSMEAVFGLPRELCYPCYRVAVRAERDSHRVEEGL